MKRPLRALGFLSAVELVVYLLAATVAWAIADHDLATLKSSFFQDVQTRLHAQIMGGVLALVILVNAAMAYKILRQGEKPIAAFGLLATAAIASLWFLPTLFSVYGLGGLIGLVVAYKILAVVWKALSWPFRKAFGKKPDAAPPAPKTAAPSKKAG
ncbi:MAG TPA: hypothetical protein VJ694_02620 [Patescibacteria group bacterium]|nr:hypothetical protein [Patescibacteria group bacterium]